MTGDRLEARRVAPQAHAEVARRELLPPGAALDAIDPARDGVLEVKQVDVVEVGHAGETRGAAEGEEVARCE
jgi:hypothetical protein